MSAPIYFRTNLAGFVLGHTLPAKEIAAALGMPPAKLYTLMTGAAEPGITDLVRIHRYMGITLQQLVYSQMYKPREVAA